MEINKTRNWFYTFTGLVTGLILLLGAWWVFLVFKLSEQLKETQIHFMENNLVSMIKWEGLSFFVLLSTLAIALLYFFYQDHRKTKATQAFFASLTHELKTPLASIRLQSQVIDDKIEQSNIEKSEKESIQKYSNRLLQDTIRLEDELDKHLQLSRLSKNKNFKREAINISDLISNEAKKHNFEVIQVTSCSSKIIANDFSLSMIFRNLFENTQKHAKKNSAEISFSESAKTLTLTYDDKGESFNGEVTHLGKLFYKHNSPKGSGIGLYLIKNLMKKNQGFFKVKNNPNLVFSLTFQKDLSES